MHPCYQKSSRMTGASIRLICAADPVEPQSPLPLNSTSQEGLQYSWVNLSLTTIHHIWSLSMLSAVSKSGACLRADIVQNDKIWSAEANFALAQFHLKFPTGTASREALVMGPPSINCKSHAFVPGAHMPADSRSYCLRENAPRLLFSTQTVATLVRSSFYY